MTNVELGFLNECEPWQVESRLFPSKVGGKPAWLSLENLPSAEDLQCSKCSKPMIFFCQIYSPLESDDYTKEQIINNFHRTIYIFVCRNPECCMSNESGNFKVLRNSLPRDNKYYSFEPPVLEPSQDFSVVKWCSLCTVCGCLAEKKCSQCKNVNYCSKEHQIQDWKEGHKSECKSDLKNSRTSALLFSEWELVTEPEDLPETNINEEEELKKYEDLKRDGKSGTMCEISDEELTTHAVADEDKFFSKFKKRIMQYPEQVLRYQKEGKPLWIAKEPLPENIPNCEYCGSPRVFEFQVMPQLLSILKENNIDFGTLAVYTCKNSCVDDIRSYKVEYIFKQDVACK